jgi:predicted enzyme related to lactoylglutathione lyase
MVSGAQILFYIDDMDAALKFYKDAIGLEPIMEEPYFSLLKVNDGLNLGLHPPVGDKQEKGEKHPFDNGETTLSLVIDDIEGYVARIQQHGGRLDRIVEPEGGRRSRMGLVFDPSGNGFQVDQVVK